MIDETTDRYDKEIQHMSLMSNSKSRRLKQIEDVKNEIEGLRKLPANNDKILITKKAKSIKKFNDKLLRTINDNKKGYAQSAKLAEIDHPLHNSNKGVKKEFEPVTIDTTAAISYILNLTLGNQSLISKKGGLDNIDSESEIPKSSKSPTVKIKNKRPSQPVALSGEFDKQSRHTRNESAYSKMRDVPDSPSK